MADEFLTPEEEDLLIAFNEGQTDLKEAIRKVLTNSIYNFGVIRKGKKHQANINSLLRYTPAWGGGVEQKATEAEVGRKIMIIGEALAEVERAFEKLEEYKKVVEKKEIINEAR